MLFDKHQAPTEIDPLIRCAFVWSANAFVCSNDSLCIPKEFVLSSTAVPGVSQGVNLTFYSSDAAVTRPPPPRVKHGIGDLLQLLCERVLGLWLVLRVPALGQIYYRDRPGIY